MTFRLRWEVQPGRKPMQAVGHWEPGLTPGLPLWFEFLWVTRLTYDLVKTYSHLTGYRQQLRSTEK